MYRIKKLKNNASRCTIWACGNSVLKWFLSRSSTVCCVNAAQSWVYIMHWCLNNSSTSAGAWERCDWHNPPPSSEPDRHAQRGRFAEALETVSIAQTCINWTLQSSFFHLILWYICISRCLEWCVSFRVWKSSIPETKITTNLIFTFSV